jgi:hypothetical protein
MGVNKILPYFPYCLYDLKKNFGKGDIHKNLISNFLFFENLRSDSHTLLRGVNEFLSILSVLRGGAVG